jgi:hypothetical protein
MVAIPAAGISDASRRVGKEGEGRAEFAVRQGCLQMELLLWLQWPAIANVELLVQSCLSCGLLNAAGVLVWWHLASRQGLVLLGACHSVLCVPQATAPVTTVQDWCLAWRGRISSEPVAFAVFFC